MPHAERRLGRDLLVMLFLGLVTAIAAGCSDDDDAWVGPTAAFTTSPICDLLPALQVVSSSIPGDAKIVMHVWSFSDGASAIGIAQEHRWPAAAPDPIAVEITLTVTDGNGLGDVTSQSTQLTSCLSVDSSSVSINGTAATPHVNVRNDSTDGDALVAFALDILTPNGLPLALDLDGGQHPIPQGQTVDVFAVAPVDCGSECAAFATAIVIPRVTSTYWCDGSCP